MNDWTIWPISVGFLSGVEKSGLTYGYNQGEKVEIPSLMYLIKGGQKLVLVDTGMSGPDWATKYHSPSPRRKAQTPLTALSKLGVTPQEIDVVICTHLHWDHCFNNSLFTKARIIVQKSEIQYALFPLPIHALYYEAFSIGMTPPWLGSIGLLEWVDGDQDIVPGVSVVRLPGHTPGFQGVNVKTGKGNYLIGGDFCPLFENWPSMNTEPIPSGIHVNLIDYYDSFKKARTFADFILPGHDSRVLEREYYPG
jgi:glyoxylase-like metal-dependent hydrolase (beta-lactamase superfamily II)